MAVDFFQSVFNFLSHGRFNTTLPTVASGATSELQCDANGRLIVNVGASVDPGATGARSRYATDAAGTVGEIIATQAKDLVEIMGQNMSANARFFQVFNRTDSPSAGAEPVITYRVEANGFFSFGYQSLPIAFSTGIVWAVSTSHDDYAASTDKFFVQAVVQDPT